MRTSNLLTVILSVCCTALILIVIGHTAEITLSTAIERGTKDWDVLLNNNFSAIKSYLGNAAGGYSSVGARLDALSLGHLADVDDALLTRPPEENQYLQFDGEKWTAGTIGTVGDEYVKVGIGGQPDYVNANYFEQDSTNHIRPKERINDGGTRSTDLWSGSYLATQLFNGTNILKQNNYYGKIYSLGNLSGTCQIPMNAQAILTATVTGNITSLTASNIPTNGYATGVVLILTANGSYSISYDTNWKWSGAKITSISTSDTIVLSLLNYGSTSNTIIASTTLLYQ